MDNHKCVDENKLMGCQCSISAMSPNDDCPVHGGGIFPPKCYYCGRFIPLQESIYKVDFKMNVKVLEKQP